MAIIFGGMTCLLKKNTRNFSFHFYCAAMSNIDIDFSPVKPGQRDAFSSFLFLLPFYPCNLSVSWYFSPSEVQCLNDAVIGSWLMADS
jgi:hypothetical protein